MKFLLVAVVLAGALAAVLVISTPRVSTPMAPLRPLNSKPSYFVSPNGSDSNPGTDARPFLSLNKAYKAAAPGETVEVEGGDYTAQQTIGYDATKEGASEPVTFIAKDHAHFEAIQPTNSYRTKIEASQVTFQGQFEFDLVLLREDVHGMSDITFGVPGYMLSLRLETSMASFSTTTNWDRIISGPTQALAGPPTQGR